jgi:hypothetical protein
VVYFAFVSGWVGEKKQKAERQFMDLKNKGIDEALMPSLSKELERVRAEIAKLEEEDKKINKDLVARSGFLSEAMSTNDTIDRLAAVFAQHDLQVQEEVPGEQVQDESLPKSIKDIRHWLQEISAPPDKAKTEAKAGKKTPPSTGAQTKDEKRLTIRKIRFYGSYLDTYGALSALAKSNIRALPVSLTMKPLNDKSGKQEWVLRLWL